VASRIHSSKVAVFWWVSAFALIPVLISPNQNMDAINLVKMSALSFFAFGSIALLRQINLKKFFSKLLVGLVLAYTLGLTSSTFAHEASFFSEFWGAQGRNTGVLTLVSFAIIYLVLSLSPGRSISRAVFLSIPLVGVSNIFYGLVQFLGKDPIDWSNPYSPIVGTLGNPNFISSHLGLVSSACLIVAFSWGAEDGARKMVIIPLLLFESLLGVFVIWKSQSIQGLLVFAIVLFTFLLAFVIRKLNNKILVAMILLFSVATGVILSLGFYGKGVFGSLLYRESFVHRTNFWQAGLEMLKSNPFFGVGIDQFGDYYRQFRNSYAVQLRGPAVTTDSAHNIPIDIGAGGGILVLLLFLALQAITLYCGISLIMNRRDPEWVSIGIFALWIGYSAQTLISINQIGVSIWGWMLAGLIVSRYREMNLQEKLQEKVENTSSPMQLWKILTLAIIGLLVSLPPLLQDRAFRQALASQNGQRIIEVSESKPDNVFFLNYSSLILKSNGYKEKALELAKRSIEINERNYVGWRMIMELSPEGSVQYIKAVKTLKSLDPLNSDLPKI